jgi:hypothetical protein
MSLHKAGGHRLPNFTENKSSLRLDEDHFLKLCRKPLPLAHPKCRE